MFSLSLDVGLFRRISSVLNEPSRLAQAVVWHWHCMLEVSSPQTNPIPSLASERNEGMPFYFIQINAFFLKRDVYISVETVSLFMCLVHRADKKRGRKREGGMR